ncbi:MAG: RAD55 family ATPase, partial [Chloroflexota bacterium]
MPSGIPRLDFIMGGGLPESFLVTIAGAPGTGKTVFVHQIAMHFAATGRNVLYVTALSGAHASLVAQIGAFSFSNPSLLGERIKFANVFAVARQSLAAVTSTIVRTVTDDKVSLVIFDGLRSLEVMAPDARALRSFAYELAGTLSSIRTTAVFTSDVDPAIVPDSPEVAIADGLLATRTHWTGTLVQRTIEVVKMRGVRSIKGPHSVLITGDGAEVFPRLESAFLPADRPLVEGRASTGVRELDEMLGGGLPRESATLVAGQPGTGKTVLGLGFVAAGAKLGEPVLFYSLQESPSRLVARARQLGFDLDGAIANGLVRFRQADNRELEPDVV